VKHAITLAVLVVLAWAPAVRALPQNAHQMWTELKVLLEEYKSLKKPFETRWPSGAVKEKCTVEADGTVSYTRFFPAGNVAVTYQRKVDGVAFYQRNSGDGKTVEVLHDDPRICDYTSWWPNGQVKEKFQYNRHTKSMFYIRYDEQGRQVIPRSP
jgi:antitoxin component YwqK of YwqJK toxin-antitoxin module